MRNTFKVLFYIKRSAPLRNGEVPIITRITINGERTQPSTQLAVDQPLWDVRMGRMMGRNSLAVRVNERLSNMRFQIERCYNKLLHHQVFVTASMVKEMYYGIDRRHETLLSFFRHHNEEFGRMVGLNRSKSTYYKYRCVYAHLEKFVYAKYERKDLAFQELDREFLAGFHTHVSKEGPFKKNTTWVYMIALKHILMLAQGRGLLAKDLFANYKLHSEFVTRNYLFMEELHQLLKLSLDQPSI